VTRKRTVYQLEPDLLLVFKPRGHLEIEHAHDYNQRVRLIRGRLEIRYATRSTVLGARSRTATIPARRPHATRALRDSWLIVEKLPPSPRGAA
jgi:hypothetical protein